MLYRSLFVATALAALSVSTAGAQVLDYSRYANLKGQWLPIGGPGRFDIAKFWGPGGRKRP